MQDWSHFDCEYISNVEPALLAAGQKQAQIYTPTGCELQHRWHLFSTSLSLLIPFILTKFKVQPTYGYSYKIRNPTNGFVLELEVMVLF